MATSVYIPKVGMTMEDGDLVRWLVPDGATVEVGQPLFEMETEKVEIEVEAEAAGVLKQLVEEGTKLLPGAVVACLLAPRETEVPAATLDEVAKQWSAPAGSDAQAPGAATGVAASAPAPVRPAVSAPRPAGGRVLASPIARKLAREGGIEIGDVAGTGPNGRITETDVRGYIESGPAAPPDDGAERIPYRGRRRTIGERMHASMRDSAQLTLFSEVDAEPAAALMHRLNREWRGDRVVVTLPSLVMKACALGLRDHPQLNSRLEGDAIVIEPQVNIGLAVDLDEGLMVPVVHGVDELDLKALASAVAELGKRAQDSSLDIDAVSGGTFTVTSLAALPIDGFTPVLNTPQSAILGVGRLRDVARFEGSDVTKGRATTLSLTFDHRVVDGAPAGRFLARVGELLAEPDSLL